MYWTIIALSFYGTLKIKRLPSVPFKIRMEEKSYHYILWFWFRIKSKLTGKRHTLYSSCGCIKFVSAQLPVRNEYAHWLLNGVGFNSIRGKNKRNILLKTTTETIHKHRTKSKGAKAEYINTMMSCGRRAKKKSGAPIKIPESFIRIN